MSCDEIQKIMRVFQRKSSWFLAKFKFRVDGAIVKMMQKRYEPLFFNSVQGRRKIMMDLLPLLPLLFNINDSLYSLEYYHLVHRLNVQISIFKN